MHARTLDWTNISLWLGHFEHSVINMCEIMALKGSKGVEPVHTLTMEKHPVALVFHISTEKKST